VTEGGGEILHRMDSLCFAGGPFLTLGGIPWFPDARGYPPPCFWQRVR
jgi:hypothetical protein